MARSSSIFPFEQFRARFARRDRCAFTLVELLVVVAIISLLISILLPALGKARDQAKALSCMARQKQIGDYFAMYLNDSNSQLPRIDSNPGYWFQAITHMPTTAMKVAGYPAGMIGTIFMCTEDPNHPGATYATGIDHTAWDDGWISHGYNVQGLGGTGWTGFSNDGKNYGKSAKLSEINQPAETLLVCDVLANNNSGLAAKGYGYHQVAANGNPTAYPRHIGLTSCNVLWVDGHVSPVHNGGTPGNTSDLYSLDVLGQNSNYAAFDTKWDRK